VSDTVAAQEMGSNSGEGLAEPVGPLPSGLPGIRLREAREARGLSVADVAGTLKFGVRQIEALEADDFRSLQGATFVRGFVRSYARFLKLPPEPLLDLLKDGATVARSEVRPPEDTGVYMPTPGQQRVSSWMAGAAALALLAAGLLAWHLLAPGSPLPVRDLATTDAPKAIKSQPELLQPVPRIEQPPASVPTAANTQSAVQVPPTGGRQLIFLFSDKSWLEVRDATQRVVLSGEFAAGERQVASGKPPYYLWVGRASALRVLDGEREIDLKPHTRDEIARLTVE
jgi:cytoskeleton protein RodZ